MKSSDRVLANKYATAYSALFEARELFDQAEKIREIAAAMNSADAFLNPAISKADKKAVLEDLTTGTAKGQYLKNLLFMLLDNKKLFLLNTIAQDLQKSYDEKSKTLRAKVTTAQTVNRAQKAEIELKLKEVFNVINVEAEYKEDASLIGGFRVDTDGAVLDGSVKYNLEKLKQILES
ncbi:F-type H+-transporting ATPase subunit delta [Elusimicrobium posterum]|uniref:ATP synthase F1 subunit delta n=1 Tax=Elusimicrobium posterum TaxID=3116653 RepID=UPI003C70F9D6